LPTKRVLVTGATGQLGHALATLSWPSGWKVVALRRQDLDLRSSTAIAAKVQEGRWAAVINAAAYTAVDKAETDQVSAWEVNALAPAALSAACAACDIPIVHVSTDYVFSGDKAGAWEIDDPVAPLGVYGASKMGGELAVRSSGARYATVRTSWVISSFGSNFVKTMLRLAADRDKLRVVVDQRGSPTSAADLASALQTIAIRLATDEMASSGTFHFSNAGVTSWAGFAAEIFRQSAERGGPFATVEPIATSEYPTAAQRPSNSLLSHEALSAAYGIRPRPWEQALGDILDDLIGVAK
jgi:dTDP-4-dehydrorhamnose reductase